MTRQRTRHCMCCGARQAPRRPEEGWTWWRQDGLLDVLRCPTCTRIDRRVTAMTIRYVEPTPTAKPLPRTRPAPKPPAPMVKIGSSLYRADSQTARRRAAIVAELEKDPARPNTEIALAVGCSGHTVAETRRDLGLPARGRGTTGRVEVAA